MNLVITLDGPAGSGKSTLARILAEDMKLYQVDSGALYRAYTYLALKNTAIELPASLDDPKIISSLADENFTVSFNDHKQEIKINNHVLTDELRTPDVTANIRWLADNRAIRELVNNKLQDVARQYSIVADGRDMGTVVFPQADVKLFITASVQERAVRRFDEMKDKYADVNLSKIEEQIKNRDSQDEKREFGGLKKADDAILIDTTGRSLKAVLGEIKNILKNSKSEKILNGFNKIPTA